ncbi:MAG: PilW family protein [Thiotrichales bacterium]
MKRVQRGLSLVELMVSLVIGLLVLAAVSSVYVSGKRSYKARDGMSLLQENGRIALKRLRSGISAAGYPGYADLQPMVSGYTDLDSLPVKPDKKRPNLEPSQNNIDSEKRYDRLTLMYIPEGSAYTEDDCLGNESAFERLVVNSYYVSKGSLVCRGSGGTTQPLAENIVNLQFQYGLDTNGDGFVDRFSVEPETEDEWSQVVSVKVGLLVSSGAEILDQVAAGRKFQVLDEEVAVPDSRISYRVFSETIPIRNKMAICNDC